MKTSSRNISTSSAREAHARRATQDRQRDWESWVRKWSYLQLWSNIGTSIYRGCCRPLSSLLEFEGWRCYEMLERVCQCSSRVTVKLTVESRRRQVSFVFRPCFRVSDFIPSLVAAFRWPNWRDIPPGAVGGTYGSGCFQFSSSFSVSFSSAYGSQLVLSQCLQILRSVFPRGRARIPVVVWDS